VASNGKGKTTSPARRKARRTPDWQLVQSAFVAAMEGKAKSVRTKLTLHGNARAAWYNFVWENNTESNARARGEARVYRALCFRGNFLKTEGNSVFLVIDKETLPEMRSAYRRKK
jgi:hypothetical protein